MRHLVLPDATQVCEAITASGLRCPQDMIAPCGLHPRSLRWSALVAAWLLSESELFRSQPPIWMRTPRDTSR